MNLQRYSDHIIEDFSSTAKISIADSTAALFIRNDFRIRNNHFRILQPDLALVDSRTAYGFVDICRTKLNDRVLIDNCDARYI